MVSREKQKKVLNHNHKFKESQGADCTSATGLGHYDHDKDISGTEIALVLLVSHVFLQMCFYGLQLKKNVRKKQKKQQITFVEHLLYARQHSKIFKCINSYSL